MFSEILFFEIRRALRKPLVYIYWGILFALGFLLMNVFGGAFDSLNMQIAGDNIKVNSPGLLNIIFGIFSYLGMFIIAGVVANIVIKDFRYDTLSLVFTTRIRKFDYIFGRFVAAFFLNILVFTGVGVGIVVGTVMPYLNQDLFGDFMLNAYLNPYLVRLIPNIFFISAIFFSLSLLVRNVLVNWLSIIALYILYAMAQQMLSDLDKRQIAALLDPFGIIASLVVTTGQSASDMNEKTVSPEGVYLYNRLIWVTVGIINLIYAYVRFRFSYALKPIQWFRKRRKELPEEEQTMPTGEFSLPKINYLSQLTSNMRMLWHQTRFETRFIIKNIYFILISLVAVIFMFVASNAIGKMYDTTTYPVTYQVIDVLIGSLGIFLYIIIILFSGELLQRDKGLKLNEITSVLPVSRWVQLGSKMIALSIAVAGLLLLMIVCGHIVQAKAGYYNFETWQYFTSVFGMRYVSYILLIVMAFFIHVLVNNKYLGYLALVVFLVWQSYFAGSVLQHNLLIFGGAPSWTYSDMNGYGFSVFPYWIFKSYWLAFASLLIIVSVLFYHIQTENSFKSRMALAKKRFSEKEKYLAIGSVCVFFLIGTYIFINTNVWNDFERSYTAEKRRVAFEKEYKKYEDCAQPKITDVSLKVDMYPESGKLKTEGTYWLKNRSAEAIDSIHLRKNDWIKETSFSRQAELVHENEDINYYIYELSESLLPGDSIKMNFSLISEAKGFSNGGKQTIVDKNGSFFNSNYYPSFGYNSGEEISDKLIRKKHNLPERKVANSIDDEKALQNNFITDDADFINFEAVLSTSEEQIALAPGNLLNSWEKDGRAYFHYKMPQKMINYYAILSAEYEIAEEKHITSTGREVELSIYHHPGHSYNLESMFRGMKESLDFYSSSFSDYTYDQMRIVEFPRYSSFAQSFPNMIPFSEGIGFIADLRELEDEEADFDDLKIDYPFFVTAHEMAHQWWAHQVIAADVEGAQMLMESITQFSAFKLMEEYYGKSKMKKFLRNESYRYVSARKNESHEERPLATVAPYQQHIYYNKGGQALYAFADYIGTGKMLETLREFNEKFAFQEGPYPTTNDFVSILDQHVPDSLQYMKEDMMSKICFYKHKVESAEYTRNEDLEYFLETEIDAQKLYADGLGKETEANMNDFIEIGVYTSDNEEIMLKKVRLKDGLHSYKFKLFRKPAKIVIDPYYKIIQKDFMRTAASVVKRKKS